MMTTAWRGSESSLEDGPKSFALHLISDVHASLSSNFISASRLTLECIIFRTRFCTVNGEKTMAIYYCLGSK